MAWQMKGTSKGGMTMKDVLLFGMELAAGGGASKGSGKGAGTDGKAKGKGKDVTPAKPSSIPDAATRLARTCRWEDCKAARAKSTTWGRYTRISTRRF